MPGKGAGAQNGKGGPKWPELCIKTVIRQCSVYRYFTKSSPVPTFRTGRFELALEVQRWTRARSECLSGGLKNYSYATVASNRMMIYFPSRLTLKHENCIYRLQFTFRFCVSDAWMVSSIAYTPTGVPQNVSHDHEHDLNITPLCCV